MKRLLAILIVSPFAVCWIALWVCICLVALVMQTLAVTMSWQVSVARGNDCTFCERWYYYWTGSVLEESINQLLDILGV